MMNRRELRHRCRCTRPLARRSGRDEVTDRNAHRSRRRPTRARPGDPDTGSGCAHRSGHGLPRHETEWSLTGLVQTGGLARASKGSTHTAIAPVRIPRHHQPSCPPKRAPSPTRDRVASCQLRQRLPKQAAASPTRDRVASCQLGLEPTTGLGSRRTFVRP
jgi:hypothetical protein